MAKGSQLTPTARLSPLPIVRADCRHIPVDDSYDTLVGRVKTQGPSVPRRVAGKAPDVPGLRQGLPLRAKSIRARDGMTAFARVVVKNSDFPFGHDLRDR